MSLLLEALKKAERENKEKSEAPAAEAAASAPAIEAAASPPAVESAESAPEVESAADAGMSLKTKEPPASAPAASTAVDFDAVPDGGAAPPSAVGAATRGSRLRAAATGGAAGARRRVEAGRVFQAKPDEAGKRQVGPLVLAFIVLIAVLGGGYFVFPEYYSGVEELISPSAPVASAPSVPASAVQQLQATEEEALPLPAPVADIQSELDYASLEVAGDLGEGSDVSEDVARRIAILTGATVEPVASPTPLTGLLVNEESAEGVGGGFNPEEAPVATALLSRAQKIELDSASAVEIEIISTSAANDESSVEVIADVAPAAESSPPIEVAASSEDSGGISVKKLASTEKRDSLMRAQSMYAEGNLAGAEAIFRRILLDDPSNVDSLRGLAQVAASGGRYQLAASIYLRLLDYHPKDPVAIAELINLQTQQANPILSEQRIKSLIGAEPAVDSRLYFSLGNIYAEQQRWVEAQESYFSAFSRDAENPDYAYNLAVTLDYLNKRDIALRYYREALKLSNTAPSGFDADTLRARIADLTK